MSVHGGRMLISYASHSVNCWNKTTRLVVALKNEVVVVVVIAVVVAVVVIVVVCTTGVC